MRMRGLEPPRGRRHTDLNRARLPIPPHPRGAIVTARTMGSLRRGLLFLLAIALFAPAPAAASTAAVEVVVGLSPPPLAGAIADARALAARANAGKLDPASAFPRPDARSLERDQAKVH